MVERLFSHGVPDAEPWDRSFLVVPRYMASIANVKSEINDHVYHPLLQPNPFWAALQDHEESSVRLVKTKEEYRRERRERAIQRQELRKQRQQHPQEQAQTTAPIRAAHLALNPIAAQNERDEKRSRNIQEHEERNLLRHLDAVPRQIQKRELDAIRYASEDPVFAAYRVYPVTSHDQVNQLRVFANDNKLHGFFQWVAKQDLFIVLCGGSKAMRHLHRWILEKMVWKTTSNEHVRKIRICEVPLNAIGDFSFQGKRRSYVDLKTNPLEAGDEVAFVRMDDEDPASAVEFLSTQPRAGPWGSLEDLWYAAHAVPW
jgi:hypothetical protein